MFAVRRACRNGLLGHVRGAIYRVTLTKCNHRSYNITSLAVNTFDNTYAAVLHPLEFRIKPMENAPAEDVPTPAIPDVRQPWMADYLRELHAEWGGDEEVRMCHCMQGALIVSLGGAAKSHVLSFFRQKIIDLEPPFSVELKSGDGRSTFRPPAVNVVGNFSKIAMYAKEHGHIIYDPDEYGLAVFPQRGPLPSGTSGSQRMSFPELLNFRTPPKGGGGFEGVRADRRFSYPNGLASTLQLARIAPYLPEDHSATTFRLLKALVPETVVFRGGGDVGKDVVGQMQSKKYRLIAEQLHENDAHAERTHSAHDPAAYWLTQYFLRVLKAQLHKHARQGDKLIPYYLKFREISERLSHYAMLDRLAASTEVFRKQRKEKLSEKRVVYVPFGL